MHVDGILRAAIDLVRQLGPDHILGDQAEVCRFLQILGFDLRGLCRKFGEACNFAIAQLATRFTLHHRAWLGRQFIHPNAELSCRIVEQHTARLDAKQP